MSNNSVINAESFDFEANYICGMKELVAGYSHIDCHINLNTTDQFKKRDYQKGIMHVNFKIICIPFFMSTMEILYKIHGLRLLPADIFTVLNFHKRYPKYSHPIAALDSVWRYAKGCFYVPFTNNYLSVKTINIHGFNESWDEKCRFAAIDFGLSAKK